MMTLAVTTDSEEEEKKIFQPNKHKKRARRNQFSFRKKVRPKRRLFKGRSPDNIFTWTKTRHHHQKQQQQQQKFVAFVFFVFIVDLVGGVVFCFFVFVFLCCFLLLLSCFC